MEGAAFPIHTDLETSCFSSASIPFQGPVFSSINLNRGVAWPRAPKKGEPRLKYPDPNSKFVYTSMENFVFRPDMKVADDHYNSNAKFKLNLPGLRWTERCTVRNQYYMLFLPISATHRPTFFLTLHFILRQAVGRRQVPYGAALNVRGGADDPNLIAPRGRIMLTVPQRETLVDTFRPGHYERPFKEVSEPPLWSTGKGWLSCPRPASGLGRPLFGSRGPSSHGSQRSQSAMGDRPW